MNASRQSPTTRLYTGLDARVLIVRHGNSTLRVELDSTMQPKAHVSFVGAMLDYAPCHDAATSWLLDYHKQG